MEIKKGIVVRLKSFSGTLIPGKNVEPYNDYWKLIGQKGEIISDETYNGRVLILFEKDLDQFKVANHNPIKNSLWILPTDLDID
ncbi:hypothetical protein ACFQZI_19480 [Mucilaginibacter lutimaris]|uniref:Uncharacterized protein n=1 Tax=Mucilaginibacter lutimaris TaxID=931629 RepID=A0ABW2ZLC0_9SPHI